MSPSLVSRHAGLACAAACAVGLGAPTARAAGTGGVEGTVVDQMASQVIAGTRISVSIACGAVHRVAKVDGVGHFVFAELPEGNCVLEARGAAYAPATLGVAVTAGAFATIVLPVLTREYVETMRKQQVQRDLQMRQRQILPKGALRPVPGAAGRGKVMRGLALADAAPEAAVPAAPPMLAPPPPAPSPAPRAAPAPRKADPSPPKQLAKVAAANQAIVAQGKLVKLDERKDVGRFGGKKARGNVDGDFVAQQAAGGWAVVRVFPVPQYSRAYDGPRSDFRETVYWNPAVETGADGTAEVSFVVSDAVTAFRATAEGFSAAGLPGGGQATFQSKLPLSLDAHLPVEVTSGDTVRLPITLGNETDEPIDATLAAQFGTAFRLTANPVSGAIRLAPHAKQSLLFPLDVVATDGSAEVAIKLTGRGLSDELKRTIRVVPRGFPIEVAASGTARRGESVRHALDLAGAMPGTIHASVTMFPSPVAAMTQGMAGMIREPGGCFEQTSSTNYPNIMILGYLNASDAADPALVAKTQGVLDRGYKLLTGYETPEKGYEWFGHNPGHEALTAYGLMEFADMAKVYDVDKRMVERTADWLMSRRDGQGGFSRSAQALDSFGRASPTTTNAYIMWALSEARRTAALGKELGAQKSLGNDTRDPYLLALAANTNLISAPKAGDTGAMVKKLAAMQAKDGSFPGAKESITMSGGESLAIETTALAVLALLKSPNGEYEPAIRAGVDWLNARRGGYGAWGNTQATILGLKALTAYSEHARQMAAPGSATLVINGRDAGTVRFDKGRRDAIVWDDIAGKLAAGKNTIELRLDSAASLPYTISVDYRSAQPASSPQTKLAVSTQLLRTQARMGEGVTLRAHVENTTAAGIPMTLARVGIPGGLVFQTWQLKELRDKGLIDFYETRPREVILYWRALPPSAKKDIDINLLAAIPGSYEAPASSAYLYYTAEDKAWTKPVAITIDR